MAARAGPFLPLIEIIKKIWLRSAKPGFVSNQSRSFRRKNAQLPTTGRSSAARIFFTVSPRPPNCPSADSSRAIVGSEIPDCLARSD
jgi:hypothetical protein